MIRAVVPGVNADKYCCDTGLSFGEDFGRHVLKLATEHQEMFPLRHNYKRVDDPKEMVKLIGKVKTRELLRRVEQQRTLFPGNSIKFNQHFLPNDLADELLQCAPDWLLELSPGEPSPILQVSQGGSRLGTHKGHKRRASLFMLLQGSGQETRWYRNKEDFEVIDPLRIPDHDKIEHVVTAVMQPFRWYVFNHFEWHSVHNFAPGSVRVNMGLDFNNVTAEELVREIQRHAGVPV
jgi:hypothetical protein